MTFDWFKSYNTDWEVFPVEHKGWVQQPPIGGVKSFRLNVNGDDDIPMLQSGAISLDVLNNEPPIGWYRVVGRMISSTGDTDYHPFLTMLFESDSSSFNYGLKTMAMTGRSVLYPANTTHMQSGEYIAKGENGAEWCRRALSRCTPAPVIIESGQSFSLNRNYVFDSGTSYLKAVWEILDSAKWVIQVDGLGIITLKPKSKTVVVRFEEETLSLFQPGVDYEKDLGSVPNVYYAEYNGQRARAVNSDPNSIVSTVNRGYVKDVIDTDPKLINGESLDHYVNRRLEEESTVIQTYSYTREVWEDVYPFDLAYYNIPGIYTGEARILTQAFDATDGGIQIQEVCGEEVKLWTMK